MFMFLKRLSLMCFSWGWLQLDDKYKKFNSLGVQLRHQEKICAYMHKNSVDPKQL